MQLESDSLITEALHLVVIICECVDVCVWSYRGSNGRLFMCNGTFQMKFYTLVIHSSAQHWKANGTLTVSSFASYNSFNFFHLVNVSLEIRNCCVILLHVFLAFCCITCPSYIITIEVCRVHLHWQWNT